MLYGGAPPCHIIVNVRHGTSATQASSLRPAFRVPQRLDDPKPPKPIIAAISGSISPSRSSFCFCGEAIEGCGGIKRACRMQGGEWCGVETASACLLLLLPLLALLPHRLLLLLPKRDALIKACGRTTRMSGQRARLRARRSGRREQLEDARRGGALGAAAFASSFSSFFCSSFAWICGSVERSTRIERPRARCSAGRSAGVGFVQREQMEGR